MTAETRVRMPVGVVLRRSARRTRWARELAGGGGAARRRARRLEGAAARRRGGGLPRRDRAADPVADRDRGLSRGAERRAPPASSSVLRPGGRRAERPEVLHVTASAYEAQDYGDNGEDIVEAVPMPQGLEAWVRDFVERITIARSPSSSATPRRGWTSTAGRGQRRPARPPGCRRLSRARRAPEADAMSRGDDFWPWSRRKRGARRSRGPRPRRRLAPTPAPRRAARPRRKREPTPRSGRAGSARSRRDAAGRRLRRLPAGRPCPSTCGGGRCASSGASNPVLACLDGLNDYDDDYTDAATACRAAAHRLQGRARGSSATVRPSRPTSPMRRCRARGACRRTNRSHRRRARGRRMPRSQPGPRTDDARRQMTPFTDAGRTPTRRGAATAPPTHALPLRSGPRTPKRDGVLLQLPRAGRAASLQTLGRHGHRLHTGSRFGEPAARMTIARGGRLRADLYNYLGRASCAPPERDLLTQTRALDGDDTELGRRIAALAAWPGARRARGGRGASSTGSSSGSAVASCCLMPATT